MMNCGVYEIVAPSGKRYVGSSSDIRTRWKHHRYNLGKNRHHSYLLQRAWNKYGKSSMLFRVILECEKVDLFAKEQLIIDLTKPAYNVAQQTGRPSSCKGIPKSESHKEKLSKALLGKPLSDAHKAAIAAGQVGTKASDDARKNMSIAQKGRAKSETHKEKLAASLRGRTLTDEHKANVSASQIGRKHSEETKAKMSATKRKNDEKKLRAHFNKGVVSEKLWNELALVHGRTA